MTPPPPPDPQPARDHDREAAVELCDVTKIVDERPIVRDVDWTLSYVDDEAVYPEWMSGTGKVPREAWAKWEEDYKVSYPESGRRNGQPLERAKTIKLRDLDGAEYDAAEYRRNDLMTGDVIQGPAVIREDLSTTRLGGGQAATVGQYGEIVIERGNA